jgi:hypothetical protein
MKQDRFERDAFNAYQNFLYKRAMYGLGVYSSEEVERMRPEKKARIKRVNFRCQQVLNIWKQQICNKFTNDLFMHFFPKRELAQLFFVRYKDTVDPGFMNTLNFKDLGISKKQIVDKLILEGVLPKDFYSLKDAPAKEEKV